MEKLLLDLNSQDSAIQVEAFGSILQVVKELGAIRTSADNDQTLVSFPNDVYFSFIKAILDYSNPKTCLVLDALLSKAMSKYLDLLYYSYRNFGKFISSNNPTEGQCSRIFDILWQVPFPFDSFEEMQTLLQYNSAPACKKFSDLKAEFSNCWMTLLQVLPRKKFRKFLENVQHKVIPFLQHPPLLSKFLSDCFKTRGLVGVLSLDALFALMQSYNLDFPEFYDHLYSLLDNQIFHSPFRIRFFKSLRLFMSSTMLPAYVVAGIVKKCSRLALSSPPEVVVWIVPFVYNLLWQYPMCRVLVHREQLGPNSDPFNDALKLSESKALESSLWEIESLTSHYWSRVSKLPLVLFEKFSKPPFDLDSIAEEMDDINTLSISKDELSHKWSRRPPVQHIIPDILF